jgi:hypothetical protein
MNNTEIKKELYKQKPIAKMLYIRSGVAYYDAVIRIEEESVIKNKTVFFMVPVEDMGDADFTPEMDAKLLIRYLVDGFKFEAGF